jgi:replicative superfamily II helicase
MIERLTEEILAEDYFQLLYLKASKLVAAHLFLESTDDLMLSDKDLGDLLRFADILSNSVKADARNKAYQVLTLLNHHYNQNVYYKTFAHSILAKLGNFPALEYVQEKNNNHSELPFEKSLEKYAKEFIQKVPFTEGLVFTDSQFELYSQLSDSKFFSFSGPTSMGKSFIIKSFIRKAISNKPPENIVILVPTRALINQFSLDLNKELREMLDHYKYKVVTNSNVPSMPSAEANHYVFVLTAERLLSFLSQPENPPIGYLFVDEAHKIAAEKDFRAVTAYTAISRALKTNPSLNLYFASPNVSNPEVFLKLFKKDEKKTYKTAESPVSQNLFFIDFLSKEITHYTDFGPVSLTPEILLKAKDINSLFTQVGNNGNNIIYCSSRKNAIDKALSLFEALPANTETLSPSLARTIRQIRAYIHKDYYLADFLSKGVAYHFGNLPQIIRNKVEALFKNSEIHFIFCTSTLLEGVNLPAKNVFILNNKNGLTTFQPIDFWNLAGRAGRLRLELSGNIFCLKESSSEWNKHAELLGVRKDIILKTTVDTFLDKKLKEIEQVLNENPNIKGSKVFVEILRYISNIICIDTMEIEKSNYQSPIIKKLIENNKQQIIDLAKTKTLNIEIPTEVLATNQSVKISIQDKVYKELKQMLTLNQDIKIPVIVNYENCKFWLQRFYKLFDWKNEVPDIKSEDSLVYYAALMNQWINGSSLNEIINNSIRYYDEQNRKVVTGYSEGKAILEVFNKNNKAHVNSLIGIIIDDIEKTLRFIFEKYFNNYYAILMSILGEAQAGSNWATFLEYGTRDPITIALQNTGLSRHSANYINTHYKNCLNMDGDRLVDINIARLKQLINREDAEYDEIAAILFN